MGYGFEIEPASNSDFHIFGVHESDPHDMDPQHFLDFLKNNVTPDILIAYRQIQARLDRTLDGKYYQGGRMKDCFNLLTGTAETIDMESIGRIQNPLPVLELREGNSRYFVHDKIFELLEAGPEKHFYFFDEGWPIDRVPDYLRAEDVVASGRFTESFPKAVRNRMMQDLGVTDDEINSMIYNCDQLLKMYRSLVEIPFNKTINRVNQLGGFVQRFNYVTSRWEVEDTRRQYLPKRTNLLASVTEKMITGVRRKNKRLHRDPHERRQIESR